MSGSLSWVTQQHTLVLQGELDRETLLPLWQQRDAILKDKTAVDLAQLQRIDSAGLALLLHFCEQRRQQGIALNFIGISERLKTLILLYNLTAIVPVGTTTARSADF